MLISLRDAPDVPIPPHWSGSIKHAYLAAFSLAHHVLFAIRSLVHYDSPFAAREELSRERLEAALAVRDEQIRILNARFEKTPPHQRPFYSSASRFAILKVKQANGWSFERAAKEFLVSAETVRKWVRALESDSLVAPPAPVNKFPDFVESLVQELKSVFPLLGVRAIADYLARGGLLLSQTSIRRFLSRPLRDRPDPLSHAKSTSKTVRAVAATSPNHVWYVDITTIPTSAGLALIGFPSAFPKKFPFSYDVVVVLDHYSRRVLAARAFLKEPSAREIVSVLDRAKTVAADHPQHIISDKGSQFWNSKRRRPQSLYQAWLTEHDVKPRFGAVGEKGSIALIERFNGTLKRQGMRCILVPFLPARMQTELDVFVEWYNTIRPHQSLNGRTPDELWRNRKAPRELPRVEPRAQYPIREQNPIQITRVAAIALDAQGFQGRSHLPQVSLRIAA